MKAYKEQGERLVKKAGVASMHCGGAFVNFKKFFLLWSQLVSLLLYVRLSEVSVQMVDT